MSASPSRLFKGKRMGGQYGNAQVTQRNLRLHKIDLENNLLLIQGAVPGPNGGMLIIKETNKVGPGSRRADS
jgi:large subunit ribosomal protein L3